MLLVTLGGEQSGRRGVAVFAEQGGGESEQGGLPVGAVAPADDHDVLAGASGGRVADGPLDEPDQFVVAVEGVLQELPPAGTLSAWVVIGGHQPGF